MPDSSQLPFEFDQQSWYRLERHDEPYRDAAGNTPPDCGWVEQMLPFIERLCPESGVVLDPFAGWGSSLIAAGRLGRRSIGAEIEPDRCTAIRARIGDGGFQDVGRVLCCDSTQLPLKDGGVDLVVGSVPYFGFWRCQPGVGAQCYRANDYRAYLSIMNRIIGELARVLRPNGHCVLAAENIWLDGRFFPLAWDVARLMADHLELGEERVLCYSAQPRNDLPKDVLRSNRAHEYVFIARPRRTKG